MKNTKKITGRRSVHYDTFADALADIEQITSQPHHALGNWNAAQNVEHVCLPLGWAIEGYPDWMKPNLFIKLLGPMIMRRSLTKGFPAGIQPPPDVIAKLAPSPDVTVEQALARFRELAERFPQAETQPRHPFFGPMTKAQHEQFNLRHAELHFSFIVPGEG